MDTAKLWFTLLWVYNIWILSLAGDCDLMIQYTNGGICCQVCPSVTNPIKYCSENNGKSVCGKCPAAVDCKDNTVCSNDKCSWCSPRPTCQPGFQLIREGKFDYFYSCEPCPDGTYKDDETGMCKSFARCDGLKMIFAGNRTHNARCACYDETNAKEPSEGQHNNNFYYILITCLAIAVLLCLLVALCTVSLSFKRRKHRTLFRPCTHKVVLPFDACHCKLSKEEMGDEETDSKTTSELSLKCESLVP